jgi:transposase InsO family protein
MNEEVVARKKRKPSPPRGAGTKKSSRFSPEQKLRAVRLRLEEGFGLKDVCAEIGVAQSNLSRWIRQYQKSGQAGLLHRESGSREDRLPAPITEKILELKKENPGFGIKRISQLLRRCFFLPASPETVRQRLHEAQLMEPTAPPKKRNMVRPRFFERATPNQMWQSDIFTFRLGGRYAYLIAFMDDYSRFIVGADLFRSPTANGVIEVYRVAVGEYQPPKEMLTDNGRQYTSWRGTSRFEAELKKDHVAHFKSRPQHPMTLGKVERFWSTIWQEFLVRAQFDSFDAARERIKLWIKHYNHKRPNQGIDGLCPADRFFEIQSQLRKIIEAGIQENLLELALRGKPQAPFYMVGRMDGQSVILRAEKGKLKLSVSDQQNQEQELTYDLRQNSDEQRKDPGQETNVQREQPFQPANTRRRHCR